MTTLNIEPSDKLVAALRYDPDRFAREMRLAAAAAWYEQGKIPQEMAATISLLRTSSVALPAAYEIYWTYSPKRQAVRAVL